MTTFLLIRHGHTDAVGQFIAGTRPGLHLNEEGQRQAADLVTRLAGVSLTAVVSSPLERAIETATPLATARRLTIQVEERLTEVDFGEWQGATFAELQSDPLWQQFNVARQITRPPGGELMVAVQARAMEAMVDLHARYPTGTVAVFSHGDVLRAILQHLLAIPIDFVQRFEVSPARISVAVLEDGPPRVLQINGDGLWPTS